MARIGIARPTRGLIPAAAGTDSLYERIVTGRCRRLIGIFAAAALAASLVMGAAPAVAQDHGFHGAAHGGGHYEGHGGGGHYEGRGGGSRYEGHWGGGHYEGHWGGGPRYAVPSHWVGMHPHWEGPHPGYWARPWGPRWAPHYWGGGYWGGRFWPHVYLGWDFPWFFATLPVGCVTYNWGGVPYYYWQGVYYVWNPDYGNYVVTDPPPLSGGVAEGATTPPPTQQGDTGDRGAMSLYVYPKNGQSEQQTDNDRYQCHQWAVGQTGYDPTNTANDTQAATATPDSYKRAMTACLQARGYSVR